MRKPQTPQLYVYRQAELLEIYAKTAREVNNSILYTKVIAFTVTKNFQQS
jgi:hypothetical protein